MNFTRRIILAIALLGMPSLVLAHALPGTTINLKPSQTSLAISIEVSLVELQLALPQNLPKNGQDLLKDHKQELLDYFAAHMILRADGAPLKLKLQSLALAKAKNEHVGIYDVLKIEYTAPFANSQLELSYDAVIHHVATHAAEVRIIHADGLPETIGVIRYNQKQKRILPLIIPALNF